MGDYGQVAWKTAFKLWVDSDDKQAAIDFIDAMTQDEIEGLTSPWPPLTTLQQEFIEWKALIVLDIEAEKGSLALNDMPFAGELSGGGGHSKATKDKDAAITCALRLVKRVFGTSTEQELRAKRKCIEEFVTEAETLANTMSDGDDKDKLTKFLETVQKNDDLVYNRTRDLALQQRDQLRKQSNVLASAVHATNATRRHLMSAQSLGVQVRATNDELLEVAGVKTPAENLDAARLHMLGRTEIQRKILTDFPEVDENIKQWVKAGSKVALVDMYIGLADMENGGPRVEIEMFVERTDDQDDDQENIDMANELIDAGKAIMPLRKKHKVSHMEEWDGVDVGTINDICMPYWTTPLNTIPGILLKIKKGSHVMWFYMGEEVDSRTPTMVHFGIVEKMSETSLMIKRHPDTQSRQYNLDVIVGCGGLQLLTKAHFKTIAETVNVLFPATSSASSGDPAPQCEVLTPPPGYWEPTTDGNDPYVAYEAHNPASGWFIHDESMVIQDAIEDGTAGDIWLPVPVSSPCSSFVDEASHGMAPPVIDFTDLEDQDFGDDDLILDRTLDGIIFQREQRATTNITVDNELLNIERNQFMETVVYQRQHEAAITNFDNLEVTVNANEQNLRRTMRSHEERLDTFDVLVDGLDDSLSELQNDMNNLDPDNLRNLGSEVRGMRTELGKISMALSLVKEQANQTFRLLCTGLSGMCPRRASALPLPVVSRRGGGSHIVPPLY